MKPQLVKNEAGKLCVQLHMGQFTATVEMPEGSDKWTLDRFESFFEAVVPEMKRGLAEMVKDNRKLRRKACDGSTESLGASSDSTSDLPPAS